MWEKDLSCRTLSGAWAIDEERVSAGTCSSSAWHFTASHWTNCSCVSSLSPPHHSASFYYLCPLLTEISTSANISLVTAGTWFLSPLTLRGSSRSLFVSRKGLRNTHDALLQWGPDSPSHELTHSCCISDLLGTTTQYSRLSTLVEERVRRSLFYCQDSFFLLLYPLLFLSNPSLSPSHIFCSKWRGHAGNGETRDRNNTPLNNLRNWRIKIMTDAVLKAL